MSNMFLFFMVPWYISELNTFIKNAINHIVLARPDGTVEGRVWHAACHGWSVVCRMQDMKLWLITAEKFLELHYTSQIQTKLDCVLSRNTQKKKKEINFKYSRYSFLV